MTHSHDPHGTSYDPLNDAIIGDNFGEKTPPQGLELDLTPQDVLEGEVRAVPESSSRSKLAPVLLATVAILGVVGTSSYYVLTTAETEEPLEQLALSLPPGSPRSLPPLPGDAGNTQPGGHQDVAPESMGGGDSALPADLQAVAAGNVAGHPTSTDNPFANAAPVDPTVTPVAAGVAPEARPPHADRSPITPSTGESAQPAASPVAPKVTVEPSVAPTPSRSPEKKVEAKKATTAAVPTPKASAPTKPATPVQQAGRAESIKASPAATGKTSTQAETAPPASSRDAVKPVVTLTAGQIGLRAFTREGLIVAHSGSDEPRMYRTGSVLPSGERVELVDARAMMVVTDRNIIRITP